MAKFEKYSVKSLANQMFCLSLLSPKSRYHTENTYFCRNTANFLSGVISFDDGTLASFREGFASFVTYITKLSDQCQSPLKVELRRRASRLPYSLRNRLYLLPYHYFGTSTRNTCRNIPFRTSLLRLSSPSPANGRAEPPVSSGYTTPGTLCSHWVRLWLNSATNICCIA